jgi:hypothetical protein
LLSLCGIVLSGGVLLDTVFYIPVKVKAAHIESRRIDDPSGALTDQRWLRLTETRQCASDILYPALVIVLDKLDRQSVASDYKQWSLAQASAITFLRHMVSCLPTDSNGWLRLAMVQRAVADDGDRLCSLLQRSFDTGPNERLAIVGRMVLYGRLAPSSQRKCEPLIRREIRTILLYGHRGDFISVLDRLPDSLADLARQEYEALSDNEKQRAMKLFRRDSETRL